MEPLEITLQEIEKIEDLVGYERALKNEVRSRIGQLDPSASVEETSYFNHSAVPDFMLKWPGRSKRRPLYIRRSYEEIVSGNNFEKLAATGVVLLSTGSRETPRSPSSLSHAGDSGSHIGDELESGREPADPVDDAQVEDARALPVEYIHDTLSRSRAKTLVTGLPVLDSLSSGRLEEGGPVASLIGSEILPGGRGLVDERVAGPLTRPGPDALDALADTFDESTMAGIRFIAAITHSEPEYGGDPPPFGRDLTTSEAANLIPWLLDDETLADNEAVWFAVASHLPLQTLESIAHLIGGHDITPLAQGGQRIWTAKRAYQGLAELSDSGYIPEPRWTMRGKLLTFEHGSVAHRFSTYGQALKPRNGTSSIPWSKYVDRLKEFDVIEVTLRGIDRTITISAGKSNDVKGDATAVSNSISDNYFVDSVTLQLGTIDEERVGRLDLGEGLVYNHGNATVGDLSLMLHTIQSD